METDKSKYNSMHITIESRGRVEDAILSHVTANGFIAVVALAQGDWSLI